MADERAQLQRECEELEKANYTKSKELTAEIKQLEDRNEELGGQLK